GRGRPRPRARPAPPGRADMAHCRQSRAVRRTSAAAAAPGSDIRRLSSAPGAQRTKSLSIADCGLRVAEYVADEVLCFVLRVACCRLRTAHCVLRSLCCARRAPRGLARFDLRFLNPEPYTLNPDRR